jgi:glycosyltransferase involved in cell wall biosynthesis
MNILIVTNLYPLPWEPNRATFNKHQFRHLGRKNKILLMVLVPWLVAVKNWKLLVPEQNGSFDVRYVPYFFTPKILRATYAIFVFLALLGKIRAIKTFKPDCLFSSWAYPDGVASTLLAKLLNIPVLIKVHGSDINEYFTSAMRRAQILWSMRQSRGVVAVSKALQSKLVESGLALNKVHVIYNGIDRTIFFPRNFAETCAELGLEQSRKRILFVGNLKRDKGCVTLLEAFQQLVIDDAAVDLYYIGSGECSSVLKDMTNNTNLQERVFQLGSMDQQKISKWMNVANVVALPSKNEGVPNVLLESMACGVPVVAFSVGGIPEVVAKGCGRLCELGDISSFVDCLRDVMSWKGETAAISASVQEMDWGTNIAKIEAIIGQS